MVKDDMIIDLRVMFYEVCKRWKLMVIVGVLLAALWTVKDWRDSKTQQSTAVDPASRKEALYASLSDKDVAEIEELWVKKGKIDGYRDYLSKSIYMNIDPYKVHMALTEVFIADAANSAQVVNSYLSYIQSGALGEKVAKQYSQEIETQYIKELMGYIVLEEDERVDGNVLSTEGANGGIFTFKVIGMEAGQCEELMQLALAALEEYKPVVEKTVGAHSMTMGDTSTSIAVDIDLCNNQTSVLTKMDTLETQYNQTYEKLSATQIELFNLFDVTESGEEATADSETTAQPANAGLSFINLKHIIFAIIVGVFLVAAACAVIELFLQKIVAGYQISDMGFARVFGVIGTKKQKWMARIFLGERSEAEEEQLKRVVAQVKVQCANDSAETIYFVGEKLRKTGDEQSEKLMKALKKEKINVSFAKDVISDVDKMTKISNGQAVVMVFELGNINMKEVKDFLKQVQELGSEIKGVVLVQ